MRLDVRVGRKLACHDSTFRGGSSNYICPGHRIGPHLWDKSLDPAGFEKRVNEHLDRAQKVVDKLLAVKGPRTIDNTLAPHGEVVELLDTGGGRLLAFDVLASLSWRGRGAARKGS